LRKNGPKSASHAVEVIDVDHRGGVGDPRDRAAWPKCLRIVRGTRSFSWATPTKTTPSVCLKRRKRCLHDVVLALAFLEADQFEVLALEEVADASDEAIGHLAGILGGGETVAEVTTQETGHARFTGKLGHVDIEGRGRSMHSSSRTT